MTAAKSLRAAMSILKKNGGEMASRQLMEQVGKEVEFSEWEKETERKVLRWQNNILETEL